MKKDNEIEFYISEILGIESKIKSDIIIAVLSIIGLTIWILKTHNNNVVIGIYGIILFTLISLYRKFKEKGKINYKIKLLQAKEKDKRSKK